MFNSLCSCQGLSTNTANSATFLNLCVYSCNLWTVIKQNLCCWWVVTVHSQVVGTRAIITVKLHRVYVLFILFPFHLLKWNLSQPTLVLRYVRPNYYVRSCLFFVNIEVLLFNWLFLIQTYKRPQKDRASYRFKHMAN